MDRNTKSLLWALLFFGIAEVALRVPQDREEKPVDIDTSRPVVFLLGSSRTEFGLVPRVIEDTLDRYGIDDAWVADVTHRALTMVGISKLYEEGVRPIVQDIGLNGFLGIEVRGAGLNDNYRVFEEDDYLEASGWNPKTGHFASPEDHSVISMMLRGRFAAGARTTLRKLELVQLRDDARNLFDLRAWANRGAGDSGEVTDGWESYIQSQNVPWAHGDRGWGVFQRKRRDDLNEAVEKRRYTQQHLKGYRIGGVQSLCLRRVITEAKKDGLRPFLYLMPVNQVHRTFYKKGDYREFLRHVKRIAEVEGIPFFDLDTDHGLANTAFLDTGHLHYTAAPSFSERFAEQVLLPVLRN